MKGLLIKDYKLMSGGGFSALNCVFIFIICCVLSLADLDTYNEYAGLGFVLAFWTVGIRNCDVSDNGLAYLLTLPVSRRGYVRASYLFSLLSACAMILVYCLTDRALGAVLQTNGWVHIFWEEIWDLFKVTLLMIALLTPFYLFFGMKKRNQYVLIAVGVIMIFIMYTNSMPLCGAIEKGVKLFKEFPVTMALFVASYIISVGIMERKDF